jgi:acyl dehydratase
MAESLPPHRVQARNAARASENKIHDDDVARTYGFRGGLVPGVTVYAYMVRPAAEALGRDWVERGTMQARFHEPVYEGEEVAVEAEREDGAVVTLTVRRPDGVVAARGRATLPAAPPAAPAVDGYPTGPLPAERPPASEEAFARIDVLGSVDGAVQADQVREFLAEIQDDLALWAEVAHPGDLVRLGNRILAQNVALGPWIHVETEAQHLRAVLPGEHLSMRGRVAQVFERKGHRFVELDLLLVAGGRDPVQRLRHTAIYAIRPAG